MNQVHDDNGSSRLIVEEMAVQKDKLRERVLRISDDAVDFCVAMEAARSRAFSSQCRWIDSVAIVPFSCMGEENRE